MKQLLRALSWALIVGSLVSCGTGPARRGGIDEPARPVAPPVAKELPPARASGALAGMPNTPNPQQAYRSRWVSVSWND
ncbi:MAG: hypothetical protein ACOVKR_04755, partial [Limnohabitans sp.]